MRVRRWFSALGAVALVCVMVAAVAAPAGAAGDFGTGEGAQAVVRDPACLQNHLDPNDDGSGAAVALPSTFNFFGQTFGSVFPNNNGNLTFSGPLTAFTPNSIQATGQFIIAAFWADVDTRGADSGLLNWGTTTFAGRNAVCFVWDKVGYYSGLSDKRNDFQIMLVDRSDTGAGNFDIYFNYDQVQWETGNASGGSGGLGGSSARAGYSNGTDTSLELPGSGVNGALIDGGPNALSTGSFGTVQLGRYIFPVRNGEAPSGGAVSGHVTDPSNNPVVGAVVQACDSSGACHATNTGGDGSYSIPGLAPGTVHVTINPPSGSSGLKSDAADATITGTETEVVDFALHGPLPLPGNTTVNGNGTNEDGTPVLLWTQSAPFTTHNCVDGVGGTVTVHPSNSAYTDVISGLTENPPHSGTYTGTIPALYPMHGDATVTFSFNCPGGTQTTSFTIYIDPSGVVIDQHGDPVANATVTLLRSDASTGPFAAVPDGSAVMSPGNRDNPDTANAAGAFGWDVIAGFYQVQAAAPGCTTATTDVLTIPPPALNLQIVLTCTPPNPTVSVDDVHVVEGLKGSQKVKLIPVTLSAPAHSDVTVTYRVQGDTATSPADFKDDGGKAHTLKFKVNKKTGVTPTRLFVGVTVYGDAIVEPNEVFHVSLTGVTGGATLGDAADTVTIIDDDNPATAVAVNDARIVEPTKGKGTTVKVTVSLASPAPSTMTVLVSATGGSATSGSDYVPFAPTTVTFKKGQYKQTVSVKVLPDNLVEGTETIELSLSNPTGGATLGRFPGVITIFDAD